MHPMIPEQFKFGKNPVVFCGRTDSGISVHDHQPYPLSGKVSSNGKWATVSSLQNEPYDPTTHGNVTQWYKEGDIVPGASVKAGFRAVHDHHGGNIHGNIEYRIEAMPYVSGDGESA